jgi:uncharacterized protein (DUF427 family)
MKQTESVWDYPRPPRLEHSTEHVLVAHRGHTLVDTTRAIRILETSHPPTYYFHPDDVDQTCLEAVSGSTFCEFKGHASYADIVIAGQRASRAAWWFENPSPGYADLAGYISLYPGRVEQCSIDGEPVQAQEGDFYGGWITTRVTGPFKGGPGTLGW